MAAHVIITHRGAEFIIPGSDPESARLHRDEAVIREQYWRPEPGQQVIDVGAAIGSWTLPALAHGASVLAVDPSPAALGVLSRTLDLNGWACDIVQAALFDGGPYPAELTAAVAQRWPELLPPAGAEFTTLDKLAAGLAAVHWVKIDTEGAELGIVRGGRDMLRRCHPVLVIEEHSKVYPYVAESGQAGKLRDLLDSLGYAVRVVPYEDEAGGPDRDYWICEAAA